MRIRTQKSTLALKNAKGNSRLKLKAGFTLGIFLILGIIAINSQKNHLYSELQEIPNFSPFAPRKKIQDPPQKKELPTPIVYAAEQASLFGLDPVLLINIINCESHFDPYGLHVNRDRSVDIGLCQYNNHYHKDMPVQDMLDPYKSIDKMIQIRLKDGDYHQWACWSLRLVK